MPRTPTQPKPIRLLLIGGGGHALVVAEAAVESAHILAGFLDDDPDAVLGRAHPGIPRLGGLADRPAAATASIIALGDLGARRGIIASGTGPPPHEVVHPEAYVSSSAAIGTGTFVGPHAVIHTLARIGAHAIINTGAIVEHECEIGENVHIGPGAVLGGRVRVGPDSLVGLGSRVLPGVVVGRGCTIGAGSVVTRDVPDGSTVAGVPARPA